jgi:hypothetical protein
MKLTDAQNQQVAAWLEAGLKLSEVQTKLIAEFGVTLTYMEVKFLLSDLSLKPKDPEPVKESTSPLSASASATGAGAGGQSATPGPGPLSEPPAPAAIPGEVTVTVDQLTRAGTMISGKVTFSDGELADWYLDQTGRLGLTPRKADYRPPQGDVMIFQTKLQAAMATSGF